MDKQQILDRLNEIIKEEKGRPVTMDDKFIDSELDSLGITITMISLDADFPFLGEGDEAWDKLDIPNLMVRDLVKLCKSSITNTSTDQS